VNAEPIQWSEEQQQQLQARLTGSWVEEVWTFTQKIKKTTYSVHFTLTSPSLQIEVKYALWKKFESGEWNATSERNKTLAQLPKLTTWLNRIAPTAHSFLEKSLEQWERALRSYLIEAEQYKKKTHKKLLANQQVRQYQYEDFRILLLRQIYGLVRDAYDDRPETEKDIWDMRKMGLAVNLTTTQFLLSFTDIAQPWLRHLAKAFMKYNTSVHSPGDSSIKLLSIRIFSHFLARYHPTLQISGITRPLIVEYLSVLRDDGRTEHQRRQLLIYLRIFLETCAHTLQIHHITRERIIFDSDLPTEPLAAPRDIPEEVLTNLREHMDTLPTTTLRMVTILLECGMRVSELCTLSLNNCLIHDDRNEWYLRTYQSKSHKEHIIPLVNEKVVGAIQAQQQEIREQWGDECPYLFPSSRFHKLPFKQTPFLRALNTWAFKERISDQQGNLYHFQSHQFRHAVGMRLINDDVSLDTISRLLGHGSLRMTERYARKRAENVRADLERAHRKRRTVNYQGQVVKGDPKANGPEAQILRKGVRGQTLPVGGCGRLIVLGGCPHANSCITCTFWLTSTDDLPALKSFYERAVRLRKLAAEQGNEVVVQQQDRIIPLLALRIKSLEEPTTEGTFGVDDLLVQLREDLAEAEGALEEVRQAGLVQAVKFLEQAIIDLRAKIAALEEK
jgi:integrase